MSLLLSLRLNDWARMTSSHCNVITFNGQSQLLCYRSQSEQTSCNWTITILIFETYHSASREELSSKTIRIVVLRIKLNCDERYWRWSCELGERWLVTDLTELLSKCTLLSNVATLFDKFRLSSPWILRLLATSLRKHWVNTTNENWNVEITFICMPAASSAYMTDVCRRVLFSLSVWFNTAN